MTFDDIKKTGKDHGPPYRISHFFSDEFAPFFMGYRPKGYSDFVKEWAARFGLDTAAETRMGPATVVSGKLKSLEAVRKFFWEIFPVRFKVCRDDTVLGLTVSLEKDPRAGTRVQLCLSHYDLTNDQKRGILADKAKMDLSDSVLRITRP